MNKTWHNPLAYLPKWMLRLGIEGFNGGEFHGHNPKQLQEQIRFYKMLHEKKGEVNFFGFRVRTGYFMHAMSVKFTTEELYMVNTSRETRFYFLKEPLTMLKILAFDAKWEGKCNCKKGIAHHYNVMEAIKPWAWWRYPLLQYKSGLSGIGCRNCAHEILMECRRET